MDTAQLAGAAETDPNAQLANAAEAFKQAVAPPPVRDELGQFAPKAEPEPEEAEEPLAEDETPEDAVEEDDAEAADETAQPMPPSWPADQADHWNTLPPETQAFIAEREGERERAVNAKFQESANARKAAEAQIAEANANRTQYAQMLETFASAIQPVEPNPVEFGYGTGQYDQEGYTLAQWNYQQQVQTLAQLNQQRAAITQQEAQEAEAQFEAWKHEREAVYAPKFLADMPELTDPAKAEPAMRELVSYAIAQGVPPETFSEENQKRIDSAELHILWKAQQFDKLRANPAQPKPKPAGPAVRPGVSSPRSAQKAAQQSRINDRLAREGSIDAGAAMWKNILKG